MRVGVTYRLSVSGKIFQLLRCAADLEREMCLSLGADKIQSKMTITLSTKNMKEPGLRRGVTIPQAAYQISRRWVVSQLVVNEYGRGGQ